MDTVSNANSDAASLRVLTSDAKKSAIGGDANVSRSPNARGRGRRASVDIGAMQSSGGKDGAVSGGVRGAQQGGGLTLLTASMASAAVAR